MSGSYGAAFSVYCFVGDAIPQARLHTEMVPLLLPLLKLPKSEWTKCSSPSSLSLTIIYILSSPNTGISCSTGLFTTWGKEQRSYTWCGTLSMHTVWWLTNAVTTPILHQLVHLFTQVPTSTMSPFSYIPVSGSGSSGRILFILLFWNHTGTMQEQTCHRHHLLVWLCTGTLLPGSDTVSGSVESFNDTISRLHICALKRQVLTPAFSKCSKTPTTECWVVISHDLPKWAPLEKDGVKTPDYIARTFWSHWLPLV